MHQALKIQEIVANVFSNFPAPDFYGEVAGDLAILARTCRSFKEPALDELWRTLFTSVPLARCLPDASCRSDSIPKLYSFHRPLTQTEWNILQGYTRRIRGIQHFTIGVDWAVLKTFLNPPTTEPLFANLRSLRGQYTEDTISLLQLPLPSLVTLHVFVDSPLLLEAVLPEASPEIRTISIFANPRGGMAPGGLIRLLQLCRSLEWIRIHLIPQGYTDVPPNHMLKNLGLTLPALRTIDVLDSAIAADSVTAITTFLSGIATCSHADFTLVYNFRDQPSYEQTTTGNRRYMERWKAIDDGVKNAQALRWSSESS